MKNIKLWIFTLLALLLVSCSKEYNYYTIEQEETPATVTYLIEDLMPEVEIVPVFFGDNVFTSYVYMIPLLEEGLPEEVKTYATKDLFELTLRSPRSGAIIEIRQLENELSNETVVKGIMPEAGQSYTIRPDISWKYEALRKWGKTRLLSVIWEIRIDGQLVGTYSYPFSFRSISECPFGLDLGDGEAFEIPAFFAGYVEEESELTDALMTKALRQNLLPMFADYQADADFVNLQAWAIWYLLQQQGIKYSNSVIIPGIEYAQNVRFIEQAYASGLANCVEGSVLLASVYTRIGFDCDLVLVPGHMFLMIRDEMGGKPLFGLETTMMGNCDLSQYATEEEKRTASKANFIQAKASGTESLEDALLHMEAGDSDYSLVNIWETRSYLPSINAGSDIRTRNGKLVHQN